MKKLFVILLAVAMTLSLAVMASAATFSPYVGGEFQLSYTGLKADSDAKTPFDLGSGGKSMMKAYVQGKVEDADTNTWAVIGAKMTCWNVAVGDQPVNAPDATHPTSWVAGHTNWDVLYSAGINKIGGVLDIQYSTDDHDTTLRGLTPFYPSTWPDNGVNKYGGDPYFTRRLGGANDGTFNFDLNMESVVVNFMVKPNQGTDAAMGMTLAGTFKFDAGNVYAGYATRTDKTTDMIVGGEFKAGDAMNIKANYVMTQPDGGTSSSLFQGNVEFTELKLTAILLYDMKYQFAGKDSTLGVGLEYAGLADGKFKVGGKYIVDDNLMQAYGIYKYGIFDVEAGYAKAKAVQTDGFVYASIHAGLW